MNQIVKKSGLDYFINYFILNGIMQKTFTRFLFLTFFICSTSINAQALKKSIQQLESAKTAEELLTCDQNFARMIDEGKKLHEAYYYGALSNLFLAFTDTFHTDDYCRKADKYLHQLD